MTHFRPLLGALALVLTTAAPASAEGGLMVTPQRVVLSDREREAHVTLTNTGGEAGAYRLFFVNYRMTPEGSFEEVTRPSEGAPFADPFITLSPKQVVLPGNGTQIARLRVRFPANVTAGEYRSHLVFQTVPRKGVDNRTVAGEGKTRAAIRTLYGISIPVIVRRGTKGAKVALGDLKMTSDAGRTFAEVQLNRTGDESVYGDFTAYLISGGGKPAEVGASNGVAVYTPLEQRMVRIPISLPETKGKRRLRIEYRNPSDDNALFAQKEFDLP